MFASDAKTPAGRDPYAIGNTDVPDRLLLHAADGSGGLVVAGPPGVGCTTLLRTVCERLFAARSATIPVYFSLETDDETAPVSARRFAISFLTQIVAFRRRDVSIAASSIGVAEIARLSAVEDVVWIDRAIERLTSNGISDDSAFIERCLAIPLLSLSAGVRPFIVFDELHNSLIINDGDRFVRSLLRVSGSFSFPFVLAGRRRFVSDLGSFKHIDIEHSSFCDAGKVIENFAADKDIRISETARDLLAVQLGGRPGFMRSVVQRAASVAPPLDGFAAVERAYAEELFAGEIGRWFDSELNLAVPRATQDAIVSALADLLRSESGPIPVKAFQRTAGLNDTELDKTIDILNVSEIIRVTANRLEVMTDSLPFVDYIESRHRLETVGEPRALVYASTLAKCIRRAPKLMAAHYRAVASLGLRELIMKFDWRKVPLALFDQKIFNERYKGRTDAELETGMAGDTDTVKLPVAVFSAHTETVYRPLSAAIELQRSAFAATFQEGTYDEADEIYWIAAEIDSKLEATREQAEFWCDRLETAAIAAGFENYRLWLIAPEGFEAHAAELLAERNAYGSSRKQAELLAAILVASEPEIVETAKAEYEIVIPMGDETELIAAHTLEEIAKRHGFKSHDINQIKTALVEACINAAEHSHSPDRRIRLQFAVLADSITITIQNRGLRLADAVRPAKDSARRGWGLKLIEKLMDEVRIEQTDDGTCLSMTKRLSPS